MTEHDNWFPRRNLCQIILQPSVNFLFRITRTIISPEHRSNNIMDIAYIKRIIDRTINTFIQLLAGFTFHQIMVTYTIKNRNSHILRVHHRQMRFHPGFITEITCMNYKSSLFIYRIVAYISKPNILSLL